MAAIISMRSEPAKMTNVKKVETVRADVERLFLAKYFDTSYHGPLFLLAR